MKVLNFTMHDHSVPVALFRQNSMIPTPHDSIDHKYPAGLICPRYGRSPVNWHARRIARWGARRFRCEIHFEANGNAAFRKMQGIEAAVSPSSFPRKILKRNQLYTRMQCEILAQFVHIFKFPHLSCFFSRMSYKFVQIKTSFLSN